MTTETLVLTDRQKREKDFYEQFVSSFNVDHEVDLSPVKGQERRPWNSYWEVYHLASESFVRGSRLLDFGSGPGDNAIRFSEIGYRIEGFDICESNIETSKKIFQRYNRIDKASFVVAAAEQLPYENESFDFIAGIDILHHVDIQKALEECRRVLKPGGKAVFREPIEVPFLDMIRNTRLVKFFSPKEKSFDLHITEDERKLTPLDLKTAEKIFPDIKVRRYFLLARFDKFFRKGSDPAPSVLEIVDHWLFSFFPFLRHLGGVIILELRK